MPVTKTIVIWDQCGQEPLQFFVLDGDYTRLDQVYINNVDNDPALEEELTALMYNAAGATLPVMSKRFPLEQVTPTTAVIVTGFLL